MTVTDNAFLATGDLPPATLTGRVSIARSRGLVNQFGPMSGVR